MIDRPRHPGKLDIGPRLRRILVALRQRAGIEAPAELDVERVREIEAAIGMHLGDDLLALFAAAIPAFSEDRRMTLGMVIGHTGALRDRRVRGDMIGVGRVTRSTFYCIDKSAPSSSTTHLVCYDTDAKSSEPLELVDLLERELSGLGPAPAAPPTLPGKEASFELTQFVPESTAVGRRVRHPKFGEGRALREMGTGPTAKVQVDFPGLGLKLMQARFLEFLD